MSLAARHLQRRRPRKDRDVTWNRSVAPDGITWVFWRRDFRRAVHMRAITLLEEEAAGNGEFGPRTLRQAWRELRDLVDEIDLEAMEETA